MKVVDVSPQKNVQFNKRPYVQCPRLRHTASYEGLRDAG